MYGMSPVLFGLTVWGFLFLLGAGMVGIMGDFELFIAGIDDSCNHYSAIDSLHRSKEITAVSLTKIGGYFS